MKENQKLYLNEKEVAKITGVAVQSLRNLRHQRRGFSYIKLGKSVRYDLSDILNEMESRKIVHER